MSCLDAWVRFMTNVQKPTVMSRYANEELHFRIWWIYKSFLKNCNQGILKCKSKLNSLEILTSCAAAELISVHQLLAKTRYFVPYNDQHCIFDTYIQCSNDQHCSILLQSYSVKSPTIALTKPNIEKNNRFKFYYILNFMKLGNVWDKEWPNTLDLSYYILYDE